jgi:hypothetical protein
MYRTVARNCAKLGGNYLLFVPKLLTVGQKLSLVSTEVSQDILDSTNSNTDFMNTVITGDKS